MIMKKIYQSVFFDLDNTLWDFNNNSREAFRIMYEKYRLGERGIPFERFVHTYHRHNDDLWEAYRNDKTDKETLRWKRFYLTLEELSIQNMELARRLDHDYIEISKTMTGLVAGALEILNYLQPRYRLFLLTNGFNEVQFAKIRISGLEKYFEKTITSEMAGVLKPNKGFFEYALRETRCISENALMIGDNAETDINGAAAAGIDTVLFNPSGIIHQSHPTWEIRNLLELKDIL